jgi:hypothetical protein
VRRIAFRIRLDRARLERQVDVLADAGQLGVRGDHVLADVLRVRARVADALDAVDGVDHREQLGEAGLRALREVAPVGADVLPEQGDLSDAVRRHPLHLGHDLRGATGHLAPPGRRHDAVRARAVAAHRDLHPGLVLALALHRQVAGEALEFEEALRREAVARQELRQLVDLARAERHIHEREHLEDLVLQGLGPAAADPDHPLGILPL